MKLNDFLYASNFRVYDSTKYGWECFPDGVIMEVTDIDDKEVGSCVFSRKDQTVYELQVDVEEDNVVYRWIDPTWESSFRLEGEKRGVNADIAWDDLRYTNVQEEKEILSLLRNVVHKTYVHSNIIPDPKKSAPKAKKAKKSKKSK